MNSFDNEVYFAKVKEGGQIPSKSREDMGYDIYACFDQEELTIQPGEIVLIPTGIASACSCKYGFLLQERGSTGTKGMAQRCGVIDSGYRGEWFVPINNTSNKTIIIKKNLQTPMNPDVTVYPYTKAICQAIVVGVPSMNVSEVSYGDLLIISSDRGMGKLGSSNK